MPYPYILSLLFCLSALTACDSKNAVKVNRDGAPALWEVSKPIEDGKKNSNKKSIFYLFGTIHLLPEGADWQTPLLAETIRASDTLIVETTGLEDTANVNKIFNQMATDEKVNGILQRLDKSDANALKNIMDNHGLSESNLSNMETWAASLAISGAMTSDLGLERSLGVETILNEKFSNRQVIGLETIPSQFSIFDDLSESDQRTMLSSIVRNSDDSKASFLRLLNAWLDGNNDALFSETNGGILQSPAIREALLDGRNRKWAKTLTEKLETPGNNYYFVAVGAAHLVGENGVPQLLKAAGYKVERIQ